MSLVRHVIGEQLAEIPAPVCDIVWQYVGPYRLFTCVAASSNSPIPKTSPLALLGSRLDLVVAIGAMTDVATPSFSPLYISRNARYVLFFDSAHTATWMDPTSVSSLQKQMSIGNVNTTDVNTGRPRCQFITDQHHIEISTPKPYFQQHSYVIDVRTLRLRLWDRAIIPHPLCCCALSQNVCECADRLRWLQATYLRAIASSDGRSLCFHWIMKLPLDSDKIEQTLHTTHIMWYDLDSDTSRTLYAISPDAFRHSNRQRLFSRHRRAQRRYRPRRRSIRQQPPDGNMQQKRASGTDTSLLPPNLRPCTFVRNKTDELILYDEMVRQWVWYRVIPTLSDNDRVNTAAQVWSCHRTVPSGPDWDWSPLDEEHLYIGTHELVTLVRRKRACAHASVDLVQRDFRDPTIEHHLGSWPVGTRIQCIDENTFFVSWQPLHATSVPSMWSLFSASE